MQWTCKYDRDHCGPAVDDVACFLFGEIQTILTWPTRTNVWNCLALTGQFKKNEGRLDDAMGKCTLGRTRLLWHLNHKFRYFPDDHLPAYIRNELANPKTAFLTTESFLPTAWAMFEEAMRQNRSLKFSHNYFSPQDTTLRKRESRIVVGSGMPEKYTRVVTDRAHHLQFSGIWKLLLSRAYDNLERANPKLEQAAIPDFVPLTLHHDGVYLLLQVTSALLGVSALAFIVSSGIHCITHHVSIRWETDSD